VQFLGAIRVDLVRFSPILVAALFLFVALGFVQFFGLGQSSLPSVSVSELRRSRLQRQRYPRWLLRRRAPSSAVLTPGPVKFRRRPAGLLPGLFLDPFHCPIRLR
jgi:hypothetical protein